MCTPTVKSGSVARARTWSGVMPAHRSAIASGLTKSFSRGSSCFDRAIDRGGMWLEVEELSGQRPHARRPRAPVSGLPRPAAERDAFAGEVLLQRPEVDEPEVLAGCRCAAKIRRRSRGRRGGAGSARRRPRCCACRRRTSAARCTLSNARRSLFSFLRADEHAAALEVRHVPLECSPRPLPPRPPGPAPRGRAARPGCAGPRRAGSPAARPVGAPCGRWCSA